MSRTVMLVTLALAATAFAPQRARAQGAEPDSALRGYLGGLADSTDRYFGAIAAPLDTAGLDSARVEGLARPPAGRRAARVSLWPDLRFDRVDGTSLGGGAGLGSAPGAGRIEGRLRYAGGTDVWLGDGRYLLSRRSRDGVLSLRLRAGRNTSNMDPDRDVGALGTMRAFISGKDSRRFLRRDGVALELGRRSAAWRASLGLRDELERALPVTTTWNLFHSALLVPDNLAATRGRAREVSVSGGLRLPHLPFDLDVAHAVSSPRLGGDFEHRRTRIALAGDIGLGRRFAAVPRLTYGRLTGRATPQTSFYLGGSSTLSAFDESALGGTGVAFGRLDLVAAFDVLEAARVPHPAALPLAAGVFVGTGAVWGLDPYTRVVTPGRDWPRDADWRPEAGVSFMYQPGIPTPDELIRVDYAWSIGPHRSGPRLSLSYTRALHAASRRGR